jgi:hypothetical protein
MKEGIISVYGYGQIIFPKSALVVMNLDKNLIHFIVSATSRPEQMLISRRSQNEEDWNLEYREKGN